MAHLHRTSGGSLITVVWQSVELPSQMSFLSCVEKPLIQTDDLSALVDFSQFSLANEECVYFSIPVMQSFLYKRGTTTVMC